MLVEGPRASRILSYCTNVHPGETVQQIQEALSRHAVPLKRRLAPDAPLALGLRLGERAIDELSEDESTFLDLVQFLSEHDFFAFTLNVFPQGEFHGPSVKEAVYLPDWTDPSRVRYTVRAARVLARLLPANDDFGTLSTVPLGFRRVTAEHQALCAQHLIRVSEELERLEDTTGRRILLCLEPEPACVLETVSEVLAFFSDHLLPAAAARPPRLSRSGAERLLRHVGVCYDVCHQAVVFDDPAYDLERLEAAGIEVGKIQLSCALELSRPRENPAGLELLRQFDEPRFLHQVVALDSRYRRHRFDDLGPFLASAARSDGPDFQTVRCHFHVPIHLPATFPLGTTQPALLDVLHRLSGNDRTPHLEVETYTFGLLPRAGPTSASLTDSLEAELRFAQRALTREWNPG